MNRGPAMSLQQIRARIDALDALSRRRALTDAEARELARLGLREATRKCRLRKRQRRLINNLAAVDAELQGSLP